MRQAKIISGSSHPVLSKIIAERLGVTLAPVTLSTHCNSESLVDIHVSVRNQDVYVIQTGVCDGLSMNDYLVQLLIIIHACKYASAKRITAVIPYFPYSKYSKKDSPRGSITSKLVADMLQISGVNHIITMDLHAPPIQSFFDIPVDNLLAEPAIAKAIKELSYSILLFFRQNVTGFLNFHNIANQGDTTTTATTTTTTRSPFLIPGDSNNHDMDPLLSSSFSLKKMYSASLDEEVLNSLDLDNAFKTNVVILAKAASATKRVTSLADKLNIDFGILFSSHVGQEDQEDLSNWKLVGDVKGKIVWIVEDIIDDPTAYMKAAEVVKKNGAAFVAIVVIHAILLKENLWKLLANTDIDMILFTNSVPLPHLEEPQAFPNTNGCQTSPTIKASNKVKILDISPLFSEAIRRIHNGEPISSLFHKHL